MYQPPSENAKQTTLDGSVSQGANSITLADASGLQAPGVLVIDRIDANGNNTPTKREYISFTGISSNTISGVTRGLGGSTDQAHSDGAIVEAVVDVIWAQGVYDTFNVEHDVTDGGHKPIGTATITNLTVGDLLASSATIVDLSVTRHLEASGASVSGNFPIHPTWFLPSNASAATTSIGGSISLPQSGEWRYVSVTLTSPISAASLLVDVNKNGSSIFESATRPSILGGGTYVSTASINTKGYSAGDIMTSDLDAGGEYDGLLITARGE